jgi:hypothetical protein
MLGRKENEKERLFSSLTVASKDMHRENTRDKRGDIRGGKQVPPKKKLGAVVRG